MVDKTNTKATVRELPYKKEVKYALTINPDDTCQFFKRTSRIARWRQASSDKMAMLDGRGIHYELWPDISTPTNSGKHKVPRLHWHGTIEFTTNLAILYWLLLWHDMEQWCHIDLDTIENMGVWLAYCKKTMHILGPIRPLKNSIENLEDTDEGTDSD